MKRTKYPIHPDFKKWEKMNPPLNKGMLPVLQKLMGLLVTREKSTDDLLVERKTIPVNDGAEIQALLYTPAKGAKNPYCLVYYHGGGFVLPAAPYHFSLAKEYAKRLSCKVLFVNYRLAPKHPFPVAPEDCYCAYEWVIEHAKSLGIDRSRVAVAGDSAGGTLAAVTCLMAKERGQIMPCAQMLIYPAVGIGEETESMKKYTDTPMCNSKDAAKYDKWYIQDANAGKPEYISPGAAATLEGMPATYIETAEFDCLRDGGIQYAERLNEFGVWVELHNTEGTIHGFDIVLDSSIVRACIEQRIAFLEMSFEGKAAI